MVDANEFGEIQRESPGNPRLLTWIRVACALFWGLVTLLLITPNPSWFLGVEPPVNPPNMGIHFGVFAMLTLLALVSRPPFPTTIVGLFMGGYAIATEVLQWLLPWRAFELKDLAEDFFGIAAGCAIFWGATKLFSLRRAGRR